MNVFCIVWVVVVLGGGIAVVIPDMIKMSVRLVSRHSVRFFMNVSPFIYKRCGL